MTISEFSLKVDAPIDTIRYYEKIGLIKPNRNKYQREYQQNDVEIFLAIRKLAKAGIKLSDIKIILNMEEADIKNGHLLNRWFQRGGLETEKEIQLAKQMLDKMIERWKETKMDVYLSDFILYIVLIL